MNQNGADIDELKVKQSSLMLGQHLRDLGQEQASANRILTSSHITIGLSDE